MTFPDPPFIAGMRAAREGQPITANPYPFSEPVQGDGYPGPYCNWRDGWTVERAWMEHDEKRNKALASGDG